MKRIVTLLIALSLLCLPLSGCGPAKDAASVSSSLSEEQKAHYTFTDDLGNTVVLKEAPKRVVSLMGSYAETWMLAGGTLAGVTEDVISERGMEVPEGTKIIGTVKNPNAEEILNLSPDFIILSTDIESHVKLADTLKNAGIPHAYFQVEYFEDYLNMLKVCTDITGRDDLYEQNGVQIKQQIDEVRKQVRLAEGNAPTVLPIRALSTAAKALPSDNMVCKMLEDLGADNIATRHASLLEELSMEEIIEEDPDFIFVITMGDSQKAIDALKSGIEANPAWNSLSAVKNGRYLVLPKDLFHYKPNAKWGESYAYLARILYPDAVS